MIGQITNKPQRLGKIDKRTEKGGTFRLLVGAHVDQGPPGCQCDQCDSADKRSWNHLYESYQCYEVRMKKEGRKEEILPVEEYRNNLITCRQDLCARFNCDPNDPSTFKFERILDEQGRPVSASLAGLVGLVQGLQTQKAPPEPFPADKMTYAQLLAHAAEMGVDIKNLSRREDVLKAILRTAEAK